MGRTLGSPILLTVVGVPFCGRLQIAALDTQHSIERGPEVRQHAGGGNAVSGLVETLVPFECATSTDQQVDLAQPGASEDVLIPLEQGVSIDQTPVQGRAESAADGVFDGRRLQLAGRGQGEVQSETVGLELEANSAIGFVVVRAKANVDDLLNTRRTSQVRPRSGREPRHLYAGAEAMKMDVCAPDKGPPRGTRRRCNLDRSTSRLKRARPGELGVGGHADDLGSGAVETDPPRAIYDRVDESSGAFPAPRSEQPRRLGIG
jgi:hypothetical protein